MNVRSHFFLPFAQNLHKNDNQYVKEPVKKLKYLYEGNDFLSINSTVRPGVYQALVVGINENSMALFTFMISTGYYPSISIPFWQFSHPL